MLVQNAENVRTWADWVSVFSCCVFGPRSGNRTCASNFTFSSSSQTAHRVFASVSSASYSTFTDWQLSANYCCSNTHVIWYHNDNNTTACTESVHRENVFTKGLKLSFFISRLRLNLKSLICRKTTKHNPNNSQETEQEEGRSLPGLSSCSHSRVQGWNSVVSR